ncbi:hypothetical protein L1887_29248 [Cichorium endivia]|nr:hypothetical protein L1887_29248 [Cichorium endivia]
MDVLRSSPSQSQDHVDPEKEEELKWTIIETDTKVSKIVKLIKGIFGNSESNQKKESEAIDLIEDFHERYQSMCAMYEDLREGVKIKCNNEEDKEDHESSSTSSSNSLSMESSAGYFSPGGGSKASSLDHIPKAAAADGLSMKSENSCYSLEDVSEVVKETLSVEPVWSTYKPDEREEDERGRTVEKLMKENGDLRDRLGVKENKYKNLKNKSSTRMKELEEKVVELKHEIEELNQHEREKEYKGRHDELLKRNNENSGLQIAFQKKERDVLKKVDECEKNLNRKIDDSMDRVHNVKVELDSLRSQKDEDRKKFLYEKEKELQSLRIKNREAEMKIKEKTEEVADLKGKIVRSMDRIQSMQTEVDALWSQNDESRKRFLYEKEKEIERLKIQSHRSEMQIKKKTEAVVDEFEKVLKGKMVQSMDRVQNVQTNVDSLRKKLVYEKEKERESMRIRNEELKTEFKNKTKQVIEEYEKILKGKIAQSMDRVQNMQMEVDTLRCLNVEARMKLWEKEKEVESLEIQLKKKTKEAADSLELLESLREKLKQKTMNEEDLQQQVKNSAVMIARINVENEMQRTTISQLNDENEKRKLTISQLDDESKKLQTTISRLNDKHEKQKTTISQLNDENEKQRSAISRLNGEHEKQKTTISLLMDEHEKQKITISHLNGENEKQKTTISRLNDDISQLNSENEKQKTVISQLEKKLQAKETQISTLESKSESVKKELSNKVKSLEHKCKSMEIDKRELEVKNDVLAGTLEQKDVVADKLNDEVKSNFRTSVKKMGDMMTDFRKTSEDNIRILSRRIRVAEQIHNETRDWYKKTRDKFEQDKIDSDMNVRTIKILMTMVNETLKVTETLGLRFVECCEDFMNRVSKVSCEINSAKDWVRRKNKVMLQLKEDYDAVVIELAGKEEEVLRSRQKVLKLESKLRELEKTVKENDEAIIVLKEEKREAIRHLCVWTDYHRSRADFLTKSLSDLLARNQRPV